MQEEMDTVVEEADSVMDMEAMEEQMEKMDKTELLVMEVQEAI